MNLVCSSFITGRAGDALQENILNLSCKCGKIRRIFTKINKNMINFIRCQVTAILVCGLFLTGCASTNSNNQNGPYDPLEPMNRAVFNFNEMVYDNILDPVARGYKRVTPDPIELVVGNFFSNLNDVVV